MTHPALPERTLSGPSVVPEQKAHSLFNPEVEWDGGGVLKKQEKSHGHVPFTQERTKSGRRDHRSKLGRTCPGSALPT